MTKKRDVVRFQVELSKDQMAEIEDLMRVVGVMTKKDLLKNALTILKWAVREKAKGSVIVSVNKRSDISNRELLMPFLESVVANAGGRHDTEGTERDGSLEIRDLQLRGGAFSVAMTKTGDTDQEGEEAKSRFHPPSSDYDPTQAEKEKNLTLTPFERWLKEQRKGGLAKDRSSATWRDFVAQTRQASEELEMKKDDVSSDKE